MANPVALKLGSFVDLSDGHLAQLERLCRDVVEPPAHHSLIREGDRPDVVFLLLEGWACRSKVLPDGKRQIVAFLVPGDLCDIHIFILKSMDHGIATLGPAKVAKVPKAEMLRMLEDQPAIARALFWATLVDEATLREWLVNVGRRDAYTRLAHLFCELRQRLDQVGLVDGDSFDMPLTQDDLGDATGMTNVQVNRTLQRLRADGLIAFERKQLTIPDERALREAADFDLNYLHLDRRH